MTGHRDWARARKARTRQLIEHGALLARAGLADRLGDDHAALYGALLALRDQLDDAGGKAAELVLHWQRRGTAGLAADTTAGQAGSGGEGTDGEAPMPSG